MSDTIDDLVGELESAAGALRAGQLDPAAAAELVERCAELAGRIGAELDRAGRAAEADPGQERLL